MSVAESKAMVKLVQVLGPEGEARPRGGKECEARYGGGLGVYKYA